MTCKSESAHVYRVQGDAYDRDFCVLCGRTNPSLFRIDASHPHDLTPAADGTQWCILCGRSLGSILTDQNDDYDGA